MMGQQDPLQCKLFYANLNIDKRIRIDHPLRKIDQFIDFNFVSKEVKDKYGPNGNVSVPPPLILKLMLLLVFYNVRSERELMDTLPERLDWLWFLGYDLDTEIPNHSVLSKARKRWGVEIFKGFFERIVWQCVEAGLVDDTLIARFFMHKTVYYHKTTYGIEEAMRQLIRRMRPIEEYGLPSEFPPDAIEEARENPNRVTEEMLSHRVDLRDHRCVRTATGRFHSGTHAGEARTDDQ